MLADRFRKLLETADRAVIEDFYAPEALLDVNVVTWRFQRKGIDQIAGQYGEWTAAGPMRVQIVREWEAPWGSVIEEDQREPAEDGNGEVYSRQLHVLLTDGDMVV